MPYQKPPIGAKLNYGHPLAKGLVGCWLCNEGSGDKVFDYSGHGNHGTIMNVAAQAATSGWSAGPVGNILQLDGTDDYVTVADKAILEVGVADFTVVVSIMFKSLPANTRVLDMGWLGSGYCSWMIYQAGASLLFYATNAGNNWNINALSIGVPEINKWYQIVIRRNGGLFTTFLNLTPGGTVSYASALYDGSAGLVMGRWGGGAGQYVNGFLSYVSIYNRALSDAGIAYLYAFPYCMFLDFFFPYTSVLKAFNGKGGPNIPACYLHARRDRMNIKEVSTQNQLA